jgi:hypothetical protein
MRAWLALAGCILVGWCGIAAGQTFYKWTDDHGTVHFSDSPPANTKDVEERTLPPPPVAVAPEGGATPTDSKTPGAGEGPARVVLVSRRVPRTGPSAVHATGEVKNVGGEDARGVSVVVSAVDATSGTPCLHEQVSVSPSTLRPGESGNFDADIDDPCLAGGTAVDISTSSE